MPDTSFEIRTRTELIDALSVAAQVEHVVLLEYLYAAFSCRGTADATLSTPVQLASWTMARDLYAIAHDEMDHLGAVQMLLAALGAPPVPDAWPLPVRGGSLPFDVELTRLDAATIDRFVRTESPPPQPPHAAIEPPDPIRFDYLGDLYRAVIDALERLGDAAFLGVGVTSDAPLPLGFAAYDVVPVATAIASLRSIVAQGEGAVTATENGHWGRFERMAQRLQALGPAGDAVAWPCVANPTTRADQADATRLTAPATVAVADVANRAYRALWLLLGNTYTFDWSTRDQPNAQQLRQSQLGRAMRGARFMMATVVRPLGEILARLPAVTGDTTATAGFCFEQYGEFRVPSQPDAREQVIAGELATLATDLRSLVAEPALGAPWAGARLGRVAGALDTIRARYLAMVPAPTRDRHEPPDPTASWLTIDFQGWYQVRLATGGDPYDDPRGTSGWQFALPGEPDLDRIIRFQPDGAHLRPAIAPGIQIGVRVSAAGTPAGAVAALTGAPVELLDAPRFEGHNGVVAADGDEPIVPLHLRIQHDGWLLRRTAADEYVVPYTEQTALGQARSPDSAALRVAMGSPVTDPASLQAHITASTARLQAAAADAQAAGDLDAAMVMRARRTLIGSPDWTFFADVGWRLRLAGTDVEVHVPAGGPAVATDGPWWLELLSTAFDPDSACALVRGVLHVPLTAGAGMPAWRLRIPAAGVGAMPLDAMGVRPGR